MTLYPGRLQPVRWLCTQADYNQLDDPVPGRLQPVRGLCTQADYNQLDDSVPRQTTSS